MNIERLTTLYNMFSTRSFPEDTGFDMGTYLDIGNHFAWTKEGRTACGTAACVAGFTILLWGDPRLPEDPEAQARRLLDLDLLTASKLFMPSTDMLYGNITPDHAAQTIHHLIATGEVKWPIR